MISKELAIEILEKALANPRYLGGKYDERTNYFCSSVSIIMVESKNISLALADQITNHIQETYIYPSINGCMFLRTYLVGENLLPCNIDRYDAAYKVAAHRHWLELIAKLKQEVATNDEKEAQVFNPS